MKKKLLITIIAVSLFIGIGGIKAQTTVSQLNQVMLLKQFSGKWQNEYAPDTSVIWEIKSYGKGLETFYKITTKGKTLREAKQLVGFDSKFETVTNSTLLTNGRIVVFTGKFTSNNKMYMEVRDKINPEKVLSRGEYAFKTVDMFTVTRIFGNYGAKPGTYYRIKE